MKKLAFAALMAVMATVTLSTGAEAGGKWNNHYHGWHNHWHGGYWGGPRIIIRPVYYDNYCFIRKVKRYDHWGNVYIKRVRICG